LSFNYNDGSVKGQVIDRTNDNGIVFLWQCTIYRLQRPKYFRSAIDRF